MAFCHWRFVPVSGQNATGKTPMNEMPLIYVFGVLGLGCLGWGENFFIGVMGNGILSLAFCPETKLYGDIKAYNN